MNFQADPALNRRKFIQDSTRLVILAEFFAGGMLTKVLADNSPRPYGSGRYGRSLFPASPLSVHVALQTADEIKINGFRITVQGSPGTRFVLESSDALNVWTALSTNQIPSSALQIQLADPIASNVPRRFYRVHKLDLTRSILR